MEHYSCSMQAMLMRQTRSKCDHATYHTMRRSFQAFIFAKNSVGLHRLVAAMFGNSFPSVLSHTQNPILRQYVLLGSHFRIHLLRGVKNHLFFPLVYLSSSAFFTVFLASSLWLTSLKVSFVTTPFRPSSSRVYRVGIR